MLRKFIVDTSGKKTNKLINKLIINKLVMGANVIAKISKWIRNKTRVYNATKANRFNKLQWSENIKKICKKEDKDNR